MLWMFFLILGSIALFVTIVIGHNHERDYRSATPTSATIDACTKEGDTITFDLKFKEDVFCTGTWNFDGRRCQGEIAGIDEMLAPGTQLQVKTNGGASAYTLTYTAPSYLPAYLVAGFLVVVVVVYVWSARHDRRRSRPARNP